MSSCVFHGSALPVSAKIAVTLGTTETMRMAMMPAPMTVIDDRIEERRDDLAAQLVLRLEEVGQAEQHRVEVARRLAGADHVDVELFEDLGMARHRVAERRALVDLRLDVGEHALEARRARPGRRARPATRRAARPP